MENSENFHLKVGYNRTLFPRSSQPRSLTFTARAASVAAEATNSSSAASGTSSADAPVLLTCRQCKQPFDPAQNHPSACSFHPAHYGGTEWWNVVRAVPWRYRVVARSYHPMGDAMFYGITTPMPAPSNLLTTESFSYHKVGKEFLYHSEETRAEWGEVENFWDCCGRNDPTDPGCTKGPHRSYDDV
ncbi:unnamed protein product [Closterium sp. NIES-54]